MDSLYKAEALDKFQQTVRSDPINQKARQSLFYGPATSFTQTKPWNFGTEILVMHPTSEAGLPHTRPPNLICMPQWFPEERMLETLKHEYIHIHQRANKSAWETHFQKEGWTPILDSQVPSRMLARCRMNPDTIDQRFYAFENRHVPLALFEREDKPDLRQVIVHWYDMQTGIRQPLAPRRFLERYGSTPPQPEHPRELSAVELAKIFQTPADIHSYLGLQ